jgi:hypothetical protein
MNWCPLQKVTIIVFDQDYDNIFFPMAQQPLGGLGRLRLHDHTQTHHTR